MKTSTETQRYSLNGETMGTRYTALFYAEAGLDLPPRPERFLRIRDARLVQPHSGQPHYGQFRIFVRSSVAPQAPKRSR